MASCSPTDEKEFNKSFLTGYWQNGTDNLRFDADGTGEQWNTADDVQEGEGSEFEWTLTGEDFTIVYCAEMSGGQCGIPKQYTMIELTSTALVYKDNVGGKTVSWNKGSTGGSGR